MGRVRVSAILVLVLPIVAAACGSPLPSSTESAGASAVPSAPAEVIPSPSAQLPARPSTPSAAPSELDLDAFDPVVGVMIDVIVAQRPELRFDLDPEVTKEAWALDGNADDGLGPGRLSVSVNRAPGALTAHPCGDPDFAQGAPCEERMLPSGDRLVLRGLVDADGIRYVNVALIRPDRSGLVLEAANFRLVTPDGAITVDDKRRLQPQPSRPDPLYTVEELGELAVAIMERLR